MGTGLGQIHLGSIGFLENQPHTFEITLGYCFFEVRTQTRIVGEDFQYLFPLFGDGKFPTFAAVIALVVPLQQMPNQFLGGIGQCWQFPSLLPDGQEHPDYRSPVGFEPTAVWSKRTQVRFLPTAVGIGHRGRSPFGQKTIRPRQCRWPRRAMRPWRCLGFVQPTHRQSTCHPFHYAWGTRHFTMQEFQ